MLYYQQIIYLILSDILKKQLCCVYSFMFLNNKLIFFLITNECKDMKYFPLNRTPNDTDLGFKFTGYQTLNL
jgi:hypothetical protein